ncbi:MAG: 2-phosphosulfolactate phosphatase, partial [Synergistaceae bacterium]
IITTSNGTKAIMRAASDCTEVRVACVRNAEAAAWEALCAGTRIGIIAAGRNGEFSIEDTVCAGMLVEKMLALAPSNGAEEMELTDGAIAAMALWHHLGVDISNVVMESEHGRILQGLGFTNDIFFCCELDETATVPRLTYFNGTPALIGR